MISEYAVPSLALNYHSKKYQIIYESVYIVIQVFVYMPEKKNTHARVHLCEMTT